MLENVLLNKAIKNFVLIIVIFIPGRLLSQELFKLEAELFLNKMDSIELSKTRLSKLDSLIGEASIYLDNRYTDSLDPCLKSGIYEVNGDLLLEVTKRRSNGSKEVYKTIESQYLEALKICTACNCGPLRKLSELYIYDLSFPEDKDEKLLQVDKQVKALGGTGDWFSFFALDLNYVWPANLIGVEICFMGAGRINQKKCVDPKTQKKYYACGYEYPMAAGLFSFGFETSTGNYSYKAFKINPIWVNTLVSLHPVQFIYGVANGKKSFIWRPELGFSFSTLSFSYGYNLPFKKSFDVLPSHILSIKCVIPFFGLD